MNSWCFYSFTQINRKKNTFERVVDLYKKNRPENYDFNTRKKHFKFGQIRDTFWKDSSSGGFHMFCQSSSSLCRRLLDFPFWVLFFLNDAGPPSSPSEVMIRSLNLGLGSGGSSGRAAAALSSVWGSCKSTLALGKRRKKPDVLCSISAYPFFIKVWKTYNGSFSCLIFSQAPYGLAAFRLLICGLSAVTTSSGLVSELLASSVFVSIFSSFGTSVTFSSVSEGSASGFLF